MSLSSKTLLVTLSISQWYNRCEDKTATQSVADKFSVKDHKDKYIKNPLPREALAPITNIVSRLRTTHNFWTQPWLDGGTRILPSRFYFKYLEQIQALELDLDAAVHNLANHLPEWIEKAKELKGALFNESDYPTSSELHNAFSIRTTFMPVSEADDFRVNLPADELQKVKSDAARALGAAATRAVDKFRQEITETLHGIRDVLVDPDTPFKATRFQILEKLCDMEPGFNLTEEKALTDFVNEAHLISQYDSGAIRESQILRRFVAIEIEKLLNYNVISEEVTEDECKGQNDRGEDKIDPVTSVFRRLGIET